MERKSFEINTRRLQLSDTNQNDTKISANVSTHVKRANIIQYIIHFTCKEFKIFYNNTDYLDFTVYFNGLYVK